MVSAAARAAAAAAAAYMIAAAAAAAAAAAETVRLLLLCSNSSMVVCPREVRRLAFICGTMLPPLAAYTVNEATALRPGAHGHIPQLPCEPC